MSEKTVLAFHLRAGYGSRERAPGQTSGGANKMESASASM
jgi:hypothetical protein